MFLFTKKENRRKSKQEDDLSKPASTSNNESGTSDSSNNNINNSNIISNNSNNNISNNNNSSCVIESTLNTSGQKVVHCDNQPLPHEPISIRRSDGAKHDLNVLTANADISDLIEQTKALNHRNALRNAAALEEHSHIKVHRSDGVNHDIISVFQNKSDSRGATMRLRAAHQRGQSINFGSPNSSNKTSNNNNSNSNSSNGNGGGDIKLNRAKSSSAVVSNFWSRSSKTGKNTAAATAAAAAAKSGTTSAPATSPSAAATKSLAAATAVSEGATTATRRASSPTATSAAAAASQFSASAAVACYFPKRVRIVHMSDTHNLLQLGRRNTVLPHGDILVHSGNFSNFGSRAEYEQFNAWLGSVRGSYHYRIVIIGSRDVKEFGNNWDSMRRLLSNATHVLCHSEAIVLGIRFYGAPWHWAHHANYSIRAGAPTATTGRFNEVPEGTQVLLTHGPAYGTLDIGAVCSNSGHSSNSSGSSTGSKELLEALRRVKPAVHLHGHVKGAHGVTFPDSNSSSNSSNNSNSSSSVLVVNSALCDPDRSVLFAAPHVLRATLNESAALSQEQRQLNYGSWTFSIDGLVDSTSSS